MVAVAAAACACSSAGSITAIKSPAFTGVPSSTSNFCNAALTCGLTMTWFESTVPISTRSLVWSVEKK